MGCVRSSKGFVRSSRRPYDRWRLGGDSDLRRRAAGVSLVLVGMVGMAGMAVGIDLGVPPME